MSLRMKLTSAVLALIMVVSLLVVGVFALNQLNFSIGGNITFKAKGINATIYGATLTNCSHKEGTGTGKLADVTVNPDKTQAQLAEEFLSWQGLELVFDENLSGNNASLSFTIRNDAQVGEEEYITVEVSTTSDSVNNASISVGDTGSTIAPQKESVFTINFTIEDATANASLSGFVINFNLIRNSEEKIVDYLAISSQVDFDFDETALTATAKKSTDTTGDIVVPSLVRYNNKIYIVNSIGSFSWSSDMTSINLPDTIESISSYAFNYCFKITSFNVPSSVKQVGAPILSYVSALNEIIVDDYNPYFYSDGSNAIIEKASQTLIQGCSATIIPYGVLSIADRAFQANGITTVDIPETVTSIGSGAFNYCNIESLTVRALTPPTISGFFEFASDYKIYIPSSAYATYSTAEGWSSYADHMYPI